MADTVVERQYRSLLDLTTEVGLPELDPQIVDWQAQVTLLQERIAVLQGSCTHTWQVKGPLKLSALVTEYAPAGEPYGLVRAASFTYVCTKCGLEQQISASKLCPVCLKEVTIGEYKLGRFDALRQFGEVTHSIFITGISGNVVIMSCCVPCKLEFLIRDEYEH